MISKKQVLVALLLLVLILGLTTLAVAKPKDIPPGLQTTVPTTTTTPTSSTADNGTDWEMIGAIVGIIAVFGGLIGWYVTKRQKSKTSNYLKDVNDTYNKLKLDSSKCEANLYLLRERIEKDFTEGKMDEKGLEFLHKRIDHYLKNIRTGVVEGLDLSAEAKKEMADMLQDGRISEEEYDSFLNSSALSKDDKSKMQKYLNKWKRKDKK